MSPQEHRLHPEQCTTQCRIDGKHTWWTDCRKNHTPAQADAEIAASSGNENARLSADLEQTAINLHHCEEEAAKLRATLARVRAAARKAKASWNDGDLDDLVTVALKDGDEEQ